MANWRNGQVVQHAPGCTTPVNPKLAPMNRSHATPTQQLASARQTASRWWQRRFDGSCRGAVDGLPQPPTHFMADALNPGCGGRNTFTSHTMRLLMPSPTLDDFIQVAELRAALRHFLRENERIAARFGLTPQRYLLLLMIKGALDGSERSTVTELSRRMQLAQHTVTELVARTVRAGLIQRTVSTEDRRVVHLKLTANGERKLADSFRDLEAERRALIAAARVRL
jgi:DNA-binding MarR family transcriptional regulator